MLQRVFSDATLQEYRVIFADSGNLDNRKFTGIHEYLLGLRQATSFKNVDCTRILTEYGADVNSRTTCL